jgi:hypothetical protein
MNLIAVRTSIARFPMRLRQGFPRKTFHGLGCTFKAGVALVKPYSSRVYPAVHPPSTVRMWPLIYELSGAAKNKAA